jgi:hypothetical protein
VNDKDLGDAYRMSMLVEGLKTTMREYASVVTCGVVLLFCLLVIVSAILVKLVQILAVIK